MEDAFVKRLLGNLAIAIAIKSFTNPLTKCYISDLSPFRHSSCSISVILPFTPRRIRRFRSGKTTLRESPSLPQLKALSRPTIHPNIALIAATSAFSRCLQLLFPERKMLRFLHRRGKSCLESCSLPSSAHCAWELRSESPKWCYIPSFYQISTKWRGWKPSGHARRTDTTPFVPDRHRYAHLHPHKTES